MFAAGGYLAEPIETADPRSELRSILTFTGDGLMDRS
jgi:hypothetical protein